MNVGVADNFGTYWKQIFVGHLVQVWDCSDAVTEKEYKDDVEWDPAESDLSSPQRCGVVGWGRRAGLVTNSIIFCWLFTITDWCKKVRSNAAWSKFALVVVDGIQGPPSLARHTWQCRCISAVLEATHEASQGSDTETRELLGGTTENSVSPKRGSLICHPGKSMKTDLRTVKSF